MRLDRPGRVFSIVVFSLLAATLTVVAQDYPIYQEDFPASELETRRNQVLDELGDQAFALVQGAAVRPGFVAFRQSNEFYYLTGLDVPHAYLLLDGEAKTARLFLPHRDDRRERSEGKTLSAEDAELVMKITGVDEVAGIEQMGRSLFRIAMRSPAPALYTFLSPAEGRAQSRDENLIGLGSQVLDPWDGRASREGQFVDHLRKRYPQFPIHDLNPILDAMRLVKSPAEIDLIRRASELASLGLLEAMRSTRPGVKEYELDAVARYVFLVNGSMGEAYRSITATGTNAYFGHYYKNQSTLQLGELILMDYAPDYRYYTSDVARMWPVSGHFDAAQRALYGFIVQYSKALISRIRPGVTPEAIMDAAAQEMKGVLESIDFQDPAHEQAARDALVFRGHLSHPVGLAVHDVGRYRGKPLQSGIVFSVDPMLWVHSQKLYVRMEDVVVVTDDGVENFTEFLPTTLEEIEKAMTEDGLLQFRPPTATTGASQ